MTSKDTEPPALPGAELMAFAKHNRLLVKLAERNLQPLNPWQLLQLFSQLEKQKKTSRLSQSGVQPGCSVLLYDLTTAQQSWIKLVMPGEAEQPEAGLISLLSPLGAALPGKECGDVVKIQLFGQQLYFQILEIIRVKHKPGTEPKR
ncbi:GreA/GreB family elongation factor [Rheinheimera sp. 4Y26]|uniref:GreA/GreB family elongation factor n=1 Tax=Rheinheimera sp. 4Y26 TaxID=2977811 RepID=UPI0021B119C2|nr:GreA/GreB family elongation factor [Rheinheimera sp. 4Y26]MCT6700515.1 GreA/GreB family elongation factor [Rheinheimera sp. 4Y26]